jgi:glycosyltransferase domain-containing protein
MVGIVIPTKNRTEFLLQQLSYYCDVQSPYPIYIADSSDDDEADRLRDGIQRFNSSLKIIYHSLPNSNDLQALHQLLQTVKQPYSAFVGDDDFFIPNSLRKCAEFLDQNPDYATANGVAALVGFASGRPPMTIQSVSRYPQRAVEQPSASARLRDYLPNYFVTLFSVHRTSDFKEDIQVARDISDKAFRELLASSLAITRGKAKHLDCLYLIRGDHPRRYIDFPSVYDWLTGSNWLPSYQAFGRCLESRVAQADGIALDQARDVVKEAFWAHLANALMKKWQHRYGAKKARVRSALTRVGLPVPALVGLWHILRTLVPRETNRLSLPGVKLRSSPYHADFMPFYRSVTGLR